MQLYRESCTELLLYSGDTRRHSSQLKKQQLYRGPHDYPILDAKAKISEDLVKGENGFSARGPRDFSAPATASSESEWRGSGNFRVREAW